MSATTRREFLRASTAAALSATVPADLFAQSQTSPPNATAGWDNGALRHLLPTVSDTRMLLKASFATALPGEPTWRIGDSTVRGRKSDTRGGATRARTT